MLSTQLRLWGSQLEGDNMPVGLTDKEKAQALARWLLPHYLAHEKVDPLATATVFGLQLIERLGLRALNSWNTEMQYLFAGIEDTTE